MSKQPGIYVEILINGGSDRIWQLTQQPDQHQRWDLRFTRIQYLPTESATEPQRLLYETKVGFGITVAGTGESVADRALQQGDVISSLKFASDDPKSLIRNGAGYWKYIPADGGLRFLTWYDYEVRFGALGGLADRLAFRPLIGWATAWSFDRLRLWVEKEQPPETSLTFSLIHAVVRLSLAFIWIWHGLVPKLLFSQIDERRMLSQAGLSVGLLPWIGVGEILFGVLILCTWRVRAVFMANAIMMIVATVVVVARSPSYVDAAFNPITLNLGVVALALVGWLASRTLPSAARCLRSNPKSST